LSIKTRISPFIVLTVFALLTIIGLAVVPLLHVNLYPVGVLPSVTISYTMQGATGELIDAEVTTPVEGALSTLDGVKKVASRTGKGYGQVTLQMDKESDMDAVRFEVSMLMRRIFALLPPECSSPNITVNKPDDDHNQTETLLVYHVNGPGDKNSLKLMLDRDVIPLLAALPGVHEVSVSGAERVRSAMVYNPRTLNEYGISPTRLADEIKRQTASAMQAGFALNNSGNQRIPVVISHLPSNVPLTERIRVKTLLGEVPLGRLVKMETSAREPSQYFRINGLNTLSIRVVAQKGVNSLETGKRVRKQMESLSETMPEYSFLKSYDATTYLSGELEKIAIRIGLSVFLLLLFILLVSRSWRYLFICFLGILVSLVLAFIFYALFGVGIHLYSLAGITLSLGLIIDNIVVMIDHLKHRNNLRVYLAILASTLTTIGALVVIFFLGEEQQLRLADFAWVIIINLSVSLVVALFLIPALMQKIPLRGRVMHLSVRRKRRVVKATRLYERLTFFVYKKRVIVIIAGILVFGLPVHDLPVTVEGRGFWANTYNNTLGSGFYLSFIKPVAKVALGGVYRPFSTGIRGGFSGDSQRRTRLSITGSMPYGATIAQMNDVIARVENYLAQFDEIDQFQTNIYSPQSANISVWFKPEHERSGFAMMLKEDVQSFCIDIGGIDWNISGVGQGFDNSLNEGYRNSRMVLYGYNLEMLKRFAWQLSDSLKTIQRVEAIFVNGRATRGGQIAYEQVLSLNRGAMLGYGINQGALLANLAQQSQDELPVTYITGEQGEPMQLILKRETFEFDDLFAFNQQPVELSNQKVTKVNRVGKINRQRVTDLINKENMEYMLVVEFDFIGSYGQKDYIIGALAKQFNQDLPIGFRIESQTSYDGSWRKKETNDKRFLIILIVIAIIYIICAILLESLLQPLAVILMIPLSFIGVFAVFWIWDIKFDDGGYASLLLLSGLTVNSALYILNDFNNLCRHMPRLAKASCYTPALLNSDITHRPGFIRRLLRLHKNVTVTPGLTRCYLTAFNHKIIPIVLTIFSTVLGFAPFLLNSKSEPFWFSLALGTMGGLVFSIIALYIYLPILVNLKRKKITHKLPENE
jgi:multidrug efflux pump subunit AcrB